MPEERKVVVFECDSGTEGMPRTGSNGANRQTVRVPCAGKLQPEHLLKAFESGADLVVVLACGEGDCRFMEGQRRIERRVDYVRGLLDEIGLGGDRLLLQVRANGRGADETLESLVDMSHLTPTPLGQQNDRKG